MRDAVLATSDLYKSFTAGQQTINVLSGISVSFQQGRTAAITGVSGTGKSTFMHLLAGIDRPTSGMVRFDGRDIATFSAAERAVFLGESVGQVFQSPHLLRELSVIENVMMPGLVRKQPYDQCRVRAEELLGYVGLKERSDGKPSTLSGGQQQRVALARALFCSPAFLLADELTGNLDLKTGTAVIDLLLELHSQFGMGIVMSTHDLQAAERMDVVYRIVNGSIVS